MSERTVLVFGATGNQGGEVVDHLLESGRDYEILAVTRNADSEVSKSLANRGVTMVEGDFADPDTLRDPVSRADTVFSVVNFWTVGYDKHVEFGKNIADVAAAEGVEHFIFSGVGSHDQDTGVPHFESAWEIDQHIQQLDLPTTTLKPVFFFQNFEAMKSDILDGTLAFPLEEGVPLQMIDVDDVGRVTAEVVDDPDRFIGERFDLAGDERTLAETTEVMGEITGRDVEPYHVPTDDAYDSFGEEFAVMCEWFNETGYSADIEALEETFGFEFTDLESYLRRAGWGDSTSPDSMPGWAKAAQS